MAHPSHRSSLLRAATAGALVLLAGPVHAADPATGSDPGPSATPASGAQSSQPTTARQGQGMDSQKLASLVGAGVAVVGIGLGTTYGVLALSRKSDAESVCPGSAVCATPEGVSKWSSAASAANVSTFMFVVAGLGALEAAVLWLTPGPSQTSTQVGLGPGVLSLRRSW